MTSYEILDIIFLFPGLENLELMGFMDIGNGIFQIHFCTQQEFPAYKFSQNPYSFIFRFWAPIKNASRNFANLE